MDINMKINYKITTECPANCSCCQERLKNFKNNYDSMLLDNTIVEKIIEIFKECGDNDNRISITGGEPTLINELPYVVKQFTRENIKVGIDTNGWNITERWLNEMELAGLEYILISYYSQNEEIFGLLRGSKNTKLFKKSSDAIRLLKEYKKASGKMKVRQQTVIMKQNYKELPQLLELAIKCGFDAFSTAYYISSHKDDEYTLNEEDIIYFKDEVEHELYHKLVKGGLNKQCLSKNFERIRQFFVFNNIPLKHIGEGYYRKKGLMCNKKYKLVIYPNGDVVPCLGFDYIMDRSYIENIKCKDYRSIINGKKFREFWYKPYILCNRCSSGFQIWLDLAK